MKDNTIILMVGLQRYRDRIISEFGPGPAVRAQMARLHWRARANRGTKATREAAKRFAEIS
jgi:hypothetical protein